MARKTTPKPADADKAPSQDAKPAANEKPDAGATQAAPATDHTPPATSQQGAAQNSAAPAPAEEKPKIVEVTGPPKGRRRAGRRFTPQVTRIPLDDLSEDELGELKADPLLAVSIV